MSDLKIIFAGPVGAGKTTAIASISDVPPVRTDEAASDMTRKKKSQTTVAFDYGVMNLDGSAKIHLYGTPGQERFDFMWDILSKNALGLVLLLDNTRKDPLRDMAFFLDAFGPFIDETAVAIGITQRDLSPTLKINVYNRKLQELKRKAAVFEVDARDKRDVSLLVQALLYTIDNGLEYAS
ncbi:MAG: GTP-binding protein [Gammaproteobacteria bacterium]|nr:GTP-binding protein [Gammaproteobacteria bacterium]